MSFLSQPFISPNPCPYQCCPQPFKEWKVMDWERAIFSALWSVVLGTECAGLTLFALTSMPFLTAEL